MTYFAGEKTLKADVMGEITCVADSGEGLGNAMRICNLLFITCHVSSRLSLRRK
jgi:hypothetical protein